MGGFEWTPRILNIPHAIAAKYARPGTNLYDELVSAGNEGMAVAAKSYRPGLSLPSTWLYLYARREIRRAACPKPGSLAARWKAAASLDVAAFRGGRRVTAGALLAAPPEGGRSPDLSEQVAAMMGLVPPECRDPLWMCYADGRSIPDVSRTLGVPKTTVYDRVQRAVRILRRHIAAGEGVAA